MIAGAIAGPLIALLIQVYVLKLLETFHESNLGLGTPHPACFALMPTYGLIVGVWLSVRKPTVAQRVVHACIAGGTATIFFLISNDLLIGARLAPDPYESRRNHYHAEGKEVFNILLAVFFFLGVVGYLTIQRMWNSGNSEQQENLSPLS